MLQVAGVPQRVWWGEILSLLFDAIRIPFAQIGSASEITHGEWRGPAIGGAFSGGHSALP
jgi:hypothetical protein